MKILFTLASYANCTYSEFWFFQKLEMIGLAACEVEDTQSLLFDHRPRKLFEDDYLRVCQIPRKKVLYFYFSFYFIFYVSSYPAQ